MKICNKCKGEKSELEFGTSKKTKDGLRNQCKECRKGEYTNNKEAVLAKRKKHYQENKDEVIARASSYYYNNKPKVAVKSKVYRDNNKEYLSAKSAEYRAKNKYILSMRKQKYYYANREKMLSRSKEYRTLNKARLAEAAKAYNLRNREKVAASHATYYQKHRETFALKAKEHRAKNRDHLSAKSAEYYLRNKDEIKGRTAKWREENAAIAKAKHKVFAQSFSKSVRLLKQLLPLDNPMMIEGFVTVTCKHCGTRFKPTNQDIRHRISSNKGNSPGENNFYCSDECKSLCLLFKFSTHNQIDPRSSQYVPDSDTKEARKCQQQSRKAFLALQLDEYGYTFCEKCSTPLPAKDLQLHHTKPVSIFGKEAIDASTQLLMCKTCHPTHASCLLEFQTSYTHPTTDEQPHS